jgi:CheY-like chemotaxis protein
VPTINIAPEVLLALADNKPVVALESTIISHGLPRPRNREAALEFEQILRDKGVVPATVAVIDGFPTVGLDAPGLATIAEQDIAKASVRDLPILLSKGLSGATTVAATAHIAAMAGIRVFATGGLGGVHRGASETFDESADLSTLAVTNITVVSAGVKSVLDIPATLERLETLSIPVIGYGTKNFPENKLVDFLQSIGIKFGQHLNAYTSFDETVYMLPQVIFIDIYMPIMSGFEFMEEYAKLSNTLKKNCKVFCRAEKRTLSYKSIPTSLPHCLKSDLKTM